MNSDKTFTALLEQLLHRPELFAHPERLTEIISESNIFRGDERRTPVKLSAEQLGDAEAAQRRLDFVAPPTAAPNVTTTPWSLFEKIGVGLPEREALLVDASIVKLAQALSEKTEKVTNVRFFGKIYGATQNYYIVEGERVANVTEQFATKPPRKGLKPPTQSEPEGKGVNRYLYWVSTNPVDEWIQLPDVTPQQIVIARLIKKLFTGDLEAPVSSYPVFPGVEKNFLRAQLARITAATQISPNNALKLFEEEEEEEEAEEEEDENAPRKPKVEKYRPLTVRNDEWAGPEEGEDPKDLALWTHHYSIIDKLGRTTKVPQQEPTEEEEEEQQDEEEEQKEEEEEEEIQLLRTLDQDKTVYEPPEKPEAEEEEQEEEPEEEVEEIDEDALAAEKAKKTIQSWVSRATNNIFKRHAVVFLRSARWPGAYAVSAEGGKRWGTLYVGDGVKYAYHAFTPSLLQLEVEAPTLTEKTDPTPLTEKRMLQGEEVPEEEKMEEEQEEEEEEAE